MHNYEPTRITVNTSSVLEQVVTKDPNIVSNIEVLPPICNSDHCTLGVNLNFKTKHTGAFVRKSFEYEKTKWDRFRLALSTFDWDICFQSNDVNVIWVLGSVRLWSLNLS